MNEHRRRKSQDEVEWEDASFVICLDKATDDNKEAPYACERVLVATWDHISTVAMDPLGIARTLPWDVFFCRRPTTTAHAVSWVEKLLRTAPVILPGQNNLTGAPLYPCYVDRSLPGIVEWHPQTEGTPTNAVAWDSFDGGDQIYTELARSHPGDDPFDNERFDKPKSSAGEYDEQDFCPVTTAAGSRVWSISFSDAKSTTTDLLACYPGQLLIRLDKGRNMILYDCFEFVPTTIQAFDEDVAAGRDICTESELVEIEKLLKQTRKERMNCSWMRFGLEPKPSYQQETAAQDQPFETRWRHINKHKFYHLLNWVRFKKSRLLRTRFPLDAICGAQFVVLNHDRPHAHNVPAPMGLLPVSRLSEHNREEDCEEDAKYTRPGSFEMSDGTVEPIGMLLLEFEQSVGAQLESDGNNPHPFASTVVFPNKWQDRRRVPMDVDWTPDGSFSRSKRHYIVGDASEIKELANKLSELSPRLKAFLCPELVAPSLSMESTLSTDELVSILESFNSLSGPLDVSQPDNIREVPTLQFQCAKQLLKQHDIPVMASPKIIRQFRTKEAVHDFLHRCGVDSPERVNACLKAGLLCGHLTVPPELLNASDASAYLDTVLLSESCTNSLCNNYTMSCTVRDALYQSLKGADEESEFTRTATKPHGWFCSGKYITKLCSGNPTFTRINHNHCTKCRPENFGMCVGYFDNRHCNDCGMHYVPGYSRCHCNRRASAGSTATTAETENQQVDTQLPPQSCWDGYLRDSSVAKGMDVLQKKEVIQSIREAILQHLIQSDGDIMERKIRACFLDEPQDVSYHVELDDRGLTELRLILLNIWNLNEQD